MDAKDLFKKLKKALNADDLKTSKQRAAVKKALKKLNKHKSHLKRDLAAASSDKERKRIEDRLKVNRAHRKKALKFLRKGKEEA